MTVETGQFIKKLFMSVTVNYLFLILACNMEHAFSLINMKEIWDYPPPLLYRLWGFEKFRDLHLYIGFGTQKNSNMDPGTCFPST